MGGHSGADRGKNILIFLNTSSTLLVISKESGVVVVHLDGTKLPESFEFVEPKKWAGMYEDYEY